MTDLMLALYEFAASRRMGYLMEDPEYADFSRCAKLQEQKLRAHLDDVGKQNLDNLLQELQGEHSVEQEAMFQAALSLSRELNALVRP
ncbi:MAG: hypothetical protein J6Q14_05635 [Oscillospiraceae bacterium]|nr:hypothetical protein [Oscillospiraceae bacterium]